MKMLEVLERDSTASPVCIKILEVLEKDLAARQTLILSQECEEDVIVDPATLAMMAIGAALPYLAAVDAKSAVGATGKTVWEWMKGKLSSDAGKEVMKDLENSPEDGDNRRATEAALSKFLRSDRVACFELDKLLEIRGAASTLLIANFVGDKNILGHVAGSGTVSIARGGTPPVKQSKRKPGVIKPAVRRPDTPETGSGSV